MKFKKLFGYLAVWGVIFIVYYLIGSSIFFKSNVKLYNDVLFGFDQSRVLFDYTLFKFPHYTQTTHPFFIIMVQPVIFLIDLIVKNKIQTVFLFNTFLLTSNLFLFNHMLKCVEIKKVIRYIMFLLYAVANGQILMTFIPETFTLSAFFLIIMHIYFIRVYNDKSKLRWYLVLLFGLISFGITITNVMQFFICLTLVLIKKDKNIKKAVVSFAKYGIVILILAFGIALFQKFIYRDMSSYFFNKNQMSATTRFIEIKKESKESEIKANFFEQMAGGGLGSLFLSADIDETITDSGMKGLNYNQKDKINFILGIILFVLLVSAILFLIRRNKSVAYISILCLIFNILLHTVFGRSEIHLYAQHYLFLLLFIFAVALNEMKSIKSLRIISGSLIIISIIIFYFNIKKIEEVKEFVKSNYIETVSKNIPTEYLMYYNLTLTGKLKELTDRGIYFYKDYIFVEDSGNYNSIELEINSRAKFLLDPENSIRYNSVRCSKDGKYVDIYKVNGMDKWNGVIKISLNGKNEKFIKEINTLELIK